MTTTSDQTERKNCSYSDSDYCGHYIRRCKFVSPCCQKIYTCRFCHNDNESHVMNAPGAEYNLQNIFAQLVICLMTALRETIFTAINAEYVGLQTMKNIYTATFAIRALSTAICRTFVERMCFIMTVPYV